VNLDCHARNSSPAFWKYLYSYPLDEPALLTGISGSIAMASRGQNFAEALISVHFIPAGNPAPVSGEMYDSYPDIARRYPAMKNLGNFIIKMPSGCSASTIPVDLRFPAGIPVNGSLVMILDGSVLRSGGTFSMSSHLAAHLAPMTAHIAQAQAIQLDDEFCFGRASGGEKATVKTSPDAAFAKVVPITQTGELLALYGDVSDSAFGPAFAGPVGNGPWAIANDYYVYHHCALRAGVRGPGDFYATIPADATKVGSVAFEGDGQASLQRAVYQGVSGVILQRGDCLVHLIHMTHASDQGGIDAENQIFALVRPVGAGK
jgi:hypothetical protein